MGQIIEETLAMITTQRLGTDDIVAMRALNALFARAFEDADSYAKNVPADGYLATVLGKPHVIVLVAYTDGKLAGGLVAYELEKLEQARSEIYIYDLAVEQNARRQGVATALIHAVGQIAHDCGAWVSFVQADYEDEPAVRLYEKLGTREAVLHFDIPPMGGPAG